MRIPEELQNLIDGGESVTVEFKESHTDITKDVYETVCSFSNREGGHIFLGVKNNGEIIGIREDKVEKIKKQFVTTVNNDSKMYPPLYLTPIPYEADGRQILYIRVPISQDVYEDVLRHQSAVRGGRRVPHHHPAGGSGDSHGGARAI